MNQHSSRLIDPSPLPHLGPARSWDAKDDALLLAAIREGDHAAFAALVTRHTKRYFALAYRFLGSREEAEDVVQEAFLALWERPFLWEENKGVKFSTWFYRVILNRSLDRRKRKTALPLLDDMPLPDPSASQEEVLAEAQQRLHLERAIRTLPERQQIALNLCFYGGLSNQEAAEVMKLNLKALQSLIMRAKMSLKKVLTEPMRGVAP